MTTPPETGREPTLLLGLCAFIESTAGGFATTRVDTDLQERVETSEFVVEVRRVGGRDMAWQSTIDVTVTVYADSHAGLWDACDGVGLLLVSRTGYVAGGWRIDRCTGTSWAEQPHPNLRVATATFRVTTRDR